MTVYDEIFGELADMTYQGFVKGYEHGQEVKELEQKIERLEAENAVLHSFYMKWYHRYNKLKSDLEKRGIYV